MTTLIEVCRLSKWLGIESIIKQTNDQLDIELRKLTFDSNLRYEISSTKISLLTSRVINSLVKIFILADVTGNLEIFKTCTQFCIDNDIHIQTFCYIVGQKDLSVVGKAYFTAHVLRDCKIIWKDYYDRYYSCLLYTSPSPRDS